jgi:hypothetical protein
VYYMHFHIVGNLTLGKYRWERLKPRSTPTLIVMSRWLNVPEGFQMLIYCAILHCEARLHCRSGWTACSTRYPEA